MFKDKNGELISVTHLAVESVEFRFHAMSFGGVARARRSDLVKSFTKYREYVDAERGESGDQGAVSPGAGRDHG